MHTVPTSLHASPSFLSSTPLSLQQYAAHSNRRRRRGDFYGVHAHLSNGFLLFVSQISNILFDLEYEFIVVYSLLIWIIVLCSLLIWNTYILVDWCPHTTTSVLILLYMRPHTAIYLASSYTFSPNWNKIRLFFRADCSHRRPRAAISVSSYCYMCVLVLQYVCPHTAICVLQGGAHT